MNFSVLKLPFLLISVSLIHPVFSQPPVEYYQVFNEGVRYWQMKPADYKNAFAKFSESQQYSDRILLINPFLSFDQIKFDADALKDGNRRYVRFLLNMQQVRPDLAKQFSVIPIVWNMFEKIKSINFRYEILKSIISNQPDENKVQLKNLFNQLGETNSSANVASIERKINEILPDYKVLSQQSISPEKIQEALKPGEVLISFLMTDNGRHVFAWKIEKNKPPQIITLKINTVDLFFRIECLRAEFQNNLVYKNALVNLFYPAEKNNPNDKYGPSPSFSAAGYSVEDNLKTLSETIIKPLNLTEGSKLIIAADQNISALPFDILPFNGKILLDKFDITYVPSAKVFYFLRKRTKIQDSKYESYIGFSFDDNGKIPDAEMASFNGAKRTIVLKASETDIYANANKIYSSDIVHFSTHGKLLENENGTISQFLQYYPDNLNDGNMTSAEIINKLHLNQSLVVLSACETAPSLDINDYFKNSGCLCSYGETFSNLTSAFLIAGARNMIMTQWNVKSKEANEFFEIFYEKLAGYKDVGKALKETKKDLLNSDNYALYAPFILISD